MYNNYDFILKHKLPKIINAWTLVLKTLVLLFIFSLFIPYNTYKNYIGRVKIQNNNSYILLEKNTPLNKNLYIDGKKYKYEIIDISDYTKIKIDLDEYLKVDSLYVNISIGSDKKTLFNELKNKIKKGIGL